MSWIRNKTPEQVRAGALEMARKKVSEGCASCVTAYIDLARYNGAAEDEIDDALAAHAGAADSKPQPSRSSPLQ